MALAVLGFHEALRRLGRGGADPVYLVTGDEDFLRRSFLAALRSRVLPQDGGMAELDLTVLEGAELPEVLAAAAPVPAFAPRRLVIAHEVPALVGDRPGEGGDEALLSRFLAEPPSHACVVLVAAAVDRRRPAARLLYERATVVECRAPEGRELPGWIVRAASARGVRIEPDAVRLLAERVGRDLYRIERELDKLVAYAGGAAITAAAVRELVAPSAELRVFDLLDAVGEGDAGTALLRLRRLLDAGEAPVALLALLGRHVRRLWEAGLRLERGATPAELQERLGLHPYAVRRLVSQARRFEPSGLRRALAAILEADEALKTGRWPPDVAVERAVLALLAAVRRPAAG